MQACVTSVLTVIALLVSLTLSCSAWGQALSPRRAAVEREESGPVGSVGSYVMTGRLERREDRYVLVDEQGELEAYLIPRESLDMDSFEGETVSVSVREPILRTEGEPRLWVDRIAHAGARAPGQRPRGKSQRSPQPHIGLAQFTEPVTEQELALPGMDLPRLDPPDVGLSDVGAPGVMVPGLAMPLDSSPTPCGPRGWIWGGAEYLLWRTDGMRVPALVTSSPAGTPRDQAGVLGEPDTVILFGGQDLLDGNTSGVRVRSGLYFDRLSQWGVQGEYFMLETQEADFVATGNASGDPILARPFFNINPRTPITHAFDPPPREDAQLISYPNVMRGTVVVNATSELQSASIALRSLLACESFCNERTTAYSRVDMITGYRYMQLNDHLFIGEDLTSLDRNSLANYQLYDLFDTRNQLHALDLGAIWQGGWQRFSLDLTAKTAFGWGRQEVDILGATAISQPGAQTATYVGGVLAQPSNIGFHSRDRFTVVPELSAIVGLQITQHVRATVGYTFIFWGPVVRVGNQMDLDVNPDQMAPPIVPLAGPLRPEFAFQESNYWAQGISAGIEGRW